MDSIERPIQEVEAELMSYTKPVAILMEELKHRTDRDYWNKFSMYLGLERDRIHGFNRTSRTKGRKRLIDVVEES